MLLTTGRLTHFLRTFGAADGIPVLLLHGSYATGRWWERFAAALPEQFYAVAPDLRGCGGSEHTAAGYEIESIADDVAALAAALEWQEFHLVGHSTGGAVAMEFALRHQELLSSLTLIDTAPAEGVFTPLDTYLLLERMRTDRELLAAALSLLMPSFDRSTAENGVFFDRLVDDAAAMAPAAFTETARSLTQWNRFADVRRLGLPVLLLWGDQDTIVGRESTTRTLLSIPGARNLEVLRNTGHSPHIEAPQAVADRFIEFILTAHDGWTDLRNRPVEPPPTR